MGIRQGNVSLIDRHLNEIIHTKESDFPSTYPTLNLRREIGRMSYTLDIL